MAGVVINSRFTVIYQELSCRSVKFEMWLEYPSGEVKYIVGYANLYFQKQFGLEIEIWKSSVHESYFKTLNTVVSLAVSYLL